MAELKVGFPFLEKSHVAGEEELEFSFGVGVHRTEFITSEGDVVSSNAGAGIENGAGRSEFDGSGEEEKDWESKSENKNRKKQIEESFSHAFLRCLFNRAAIFSISTGFLPRILARGASGRMSRLFLVSWGLLALM